MSILLRLVRYLLTRYQLDHKDELCGGTRAGATGAGGSFDQLSEHPPGGGGTSPSPTLCSAEH